MNRLVPPFPTPEVSIMIMQSIGLSLDLKPTQKVLVGISQEVLRQEAWAHQVAPTGHIALLQGETGVGKGYYAEYLHLLSRPSKPFVKVHCATLPHHLVESELFGYARGAFSGAVGDKKGLIEAAKEGTLFVDDIDTLPIDLQPKLLSAMEDGVFRPLGSVREILMKARIIVGTNANLEQKIADKQFREDLYYRINIFSCTLAPLRERRVDIPMLAQRFIEQEKSEKQFSPPAMQRMADYRWPGNIRELRAAVIRAVVFSGGTEKIGVEHVGPYLGNGYPKPILPLPEPSAPEKTLRFSTEVKMIAFQEALREAGGNICKASRIAGISRKGGYARVSAWGLTEFVNSLRKGRHL